LKVSIKYNGFYNLLNKHQMNIIAHKLGDKLQWFLYFVICRFGFHKWVNIKPYTPRPKNGKMIYFQNLHECSRCKKQEFKGMGCIC